MNLKAGHKLEHNGIDFNDENNSYSVELPNRLTMDELIDAIRDKIQKTLDNKTQKKFTSQSSADVKPHSISNTVQRE